VSAVPPSVLIVGAASDMAAAIAEIFAADGYALVLAARDPARLAAPARALGERHGTPVEVRGLDILRTADHAAFIDGLPVLPDVAVMVVGLLGDQPLAERDAGHAALVMRSNYEGPALLLGALAERFAARGSGTLVGISSVAGDRGRASNYVYGSAKAGFTAYLSGLRNRLAAGGVHVVTVKPGYVATAMTAGLRLPRALTGTPRDVARAVRSACRSRRDVVYVLPVWRAIMTVIALIPERIFKRLSL